MNVVSLAPSNTEIVYALDAEDFLVATTSLCNYPEEAARKPSIGGWTDPRIEDVEQHDPDLVLASDDLQDEAVRKLRDRGFEVLQVKPHSLEEVFDSFRKIGEKLGRREEAEDLVSDMKSSLEKIDLEGRRIYCEEWMDPPMVSGNWIPDLVERVNGDYFIDGGRSREFKPEELKSFDPEHIFLNVCGAGENLSPEIVERRDDWSGISAVKSGNIHVIDDSLLNRPGPRLVEAAREMEKMIN